MKKSVANVVIFLLLCVPLYPGLAAPPAPETSSDSAFDPRLLPTIAVIVLGDKFERSLTVLGDKQTGLQRLIEDEFVSVLMNSGYSLAARSDLRSVLKELILEQSGLTQGDAAAIGKLLNVAAVIFVSVTELKIDDPNQKKTQSRAATSRLRISVAMSARLIHVESAKLLWTGKFRQSLTVADSSRVLPVVTDVAKSVASALPKRPKDALSGQMPKPSSASPTAAPMNVPSNLPKGETKDDTRSRWVNTSYFSKIYHVEGKKWAEAEDATGDVKWFLTETDRTKDYIELLNSTPNHPAAGKWRIFANRMEMDLKKDNRWTWGANGHWQK